MDDLPAVPALRRRMIDRRPDAEVPAQSPGHPRLPLDAIDLLARAGTGGVFLWAGAT